MQPITAKRYQNLIGGRWVESSSDETFASINPADISDILGYFPRSTIEDARRAIEAARAAQAAWAEAPPARRAEVLYKAAELIEAKGPDLAELLTREEGKTLAESLAEVRRTAANFRFFATQAYLVGGETLPSDDPSTFLYTLREPLGVVSVITPWNFPLSIPSRKIAPALAAGNTVVFKPASLTPLLGLKLGEILQLAGLPNGAINVVVGPATTVGNELVTHCAINAITFTGSYNVGDSIRRRASITCRTQLEMGGKNPIIVLEDADLDVAVSCTVQGAFGLSGQACTGTSRAIVVKKALGQFTEKLIDATRRLKVGSGLKEGVKMGPVADAQQEKTIIEYIEIGKAEGAELLCGGEKLRGGEYDRGFFIEPTIFGRVRPDMRIAQEEIFGPVLAVIEASDFDEAIEIANRVEYGLSASICTRDLGRAQRFARLVEAGMVKVNQPTTGVAINAPFGGMKKSSTETYREQGRIAMEFFTRVKTVSIRYGD